MDGESETPAAAAAWWAKRAWELLSMVRRRAPLVQCITNLVSMDLAANVLLAAGASPAMVHAIQEIDDFTPNVDSLCVNLGTLADSWVPSMRVAAATAERARRPWVLDPVAVSASEWRMGTCLGLVELRPTVIRGNASEILALSSACRIRGAKGAKCSHESTDAVEVEIISKITDQETIFRMIVEPFSCPFSVCHAPLDKIHEQGADSSHESADAVEAAKSLAQSSGAIVAVSGAIDFITDGQKVVSASNGVSMMQRITATGCAVTALIAAFVAVDPSNALEATSCALSIFGLAGELGMEMAKGPASLRMHMIDALHCLDENTIVSRIRISQLS